MSNLPSNYELFFEESAIRSRIKAISLEITDWALSVNRNTSQSIVVVPLMKGAMLFAADLIREIDVSVEVMPLRASYYQTTTNERSSELHITPEFDFDVYGRTVLIVDDIFDSGATLAGVTEQLKKLGASQIKSAVVIHRSTEQVKQKADWTCFEFKGKEWLVGYGMDDRNQYRNLRDIYYMKGTGQ